MSRGRLISPRRSIFIGVEGRSDRAFVQFLRKCCERKGKRHLHLYVRVASKAVAIRLTWSNTLYAILSNRSFVEGVSSAKIRVA